MSSFFCVSVLVYLLLYVYLQTETAPGGSAAGPSGIMGSVLLITF